MTRVFCDESGFTGNNLWQAEQPYFVYAGVQIEELEAKALVDEAMQKFALQGPEIHAARMLKRAKGTEAVKWLLERTAHNTTIVCMHKRFCLAGKMYEYLIEPIVSENSLAYYESGFHRFIANLLYHDLLAESSSDSPLFESFQNLMRKLDVTQLDQLTDSIDTNSCSESMLDFQTVLVCNRPRIVTELETCGSSDGVGNWILDLSLTAMRSILTHFSGTDMRPLHVTCDESKPLQSSAHHLNEIGLGRTDYQSIRFDGREAAITFSLSRNIAFDSSDNSYGIQLADVAASAVSFVLRKPTSEFAEFWRTNCKDSLHNDCVYPDSQELELDTIRVVRNALILKELSRKSVNGESLVTGSFETIATARKAAELFLTEKVS